ncbi:MAG: UDP-2,3-diacylglucosamine diphosphatase [Candidatus Thiodiazotropha sp. (ex Ctena orbiculata)]|uniref:UDP-2,3-diacylglucosamine diphosphatase n=1 Tax=Candidatus Thiodiazotropha taylori TaxID=2792791 RepID=A0A944M8M4_9GAMM|nr:UDP-2,3-diacylglucosamine diphosphatase [Candidatus Thiodiazotropha taylori]MBT2988239.1 UDP-2,3-diacylglucosamine diphosphatase [Candidatus Thiodiazotropha taylori]MBT2996206.1 UDP-2,3-diacylglucosamine diphosphatase [Candidatus Thiodiazotropha taylori]MBT2999648.1 UDP-2,3-diacylglucosamine diphosphatase [Candidatus Thiodiazotropha taylori]MBV2106293.1 UDP-2,3-diacylglucosamine diphosphatase [Candidatus Thiodiazotropha taylori]
MTTLRYKSLFISDTHLGLRASRTEYLLDFLKHTDSDNLYLVGDILDFWKMRSGWYWPNINNEIVHQIIAKAKRGTRVVYVPGNHDEVMRDYFNFHISGIEIQKEVIHTTADNKRFLILHGDEFDGVVMNNKWLAHLGSDAYDLLLWLNRWFNIARRRLGFGYWSLSAYLKNQVKEAVKYIGNYEEAVIHTVRERNLDGVICGHIHHAVINEMDGLTYANCGDWVESCTALAETPDGSLKLIRWVDESMQLLETAASPTPTPTPVVPDPTPVVAKNEPIKARKVA